MDFDLRRGLQDLGNHAGADAGDLPVATLLRRAHRRRAAVTTAYGAVGAGTVTALAFGGVALLDREPEPPVAVDPTPTPTPSLTPTPTATPTATPSQTPTAPATVTDLGADPGWTDAWTYCGGAVEGSAEGSLAAELTGIPERVAVGEDWTAAVTIPTATDPAAGLQVTFLGPFAFADGGIVGVPRSAPHSHELTPGAAPWSVPVSGDLASCVGAPAGPGGTAEAPELAAGTYGTAGFLEYTENGQTVVVPVFGPDLTVSGSGGAVIPSTPTSMGPTVRLDVIQSDPTISCGREAVGLGYEPPAFPAALTGPTARLVDGELVVSATLLNTGRSASAATTENVYVQVVKDGRVVGDVELAGGRVGLGPWPTGGGIPIEVSLGQFTCTFALGEPWPAGSYQLQVTASVDNGTAFGAWATGEAAFTLP